MSRRENVPNSDLWTPSFHPPAVDDSEWLGWTLLDLLADLPEMLIQYLLLNIRRQVLAFGRLCSRRTNSGDRRRNRQRD
jgi:hypothetical protein